MKPVFVIEHLEPQLWPWCIIEYRHMSELVGKNSLWISNIKNKADARKIDPYASIFLKPFKDLKFDPKKTCILDPEAPETLTPENSKNYQYFLFGGILGDYPPRKRTESELTKFFPGVKAFNIGKEQMSTDNAVFVVKRIIEGERLENIKFQNGVSIEINEFESVDLPYNYALVNGKPYMSQEIIEYLKKKKGF